MPTFKVDPFFDSMTTNPKVLGVILEILIKTIKNIIRILKLKQRTDF